VFGISADGASNLADPESHNRSLIIAQVVSEACGDRSPAVHDANIFDMSAKMADVVPEAEAIEKLKAGWS
jgi:hypothetical protein